MTRIVGRYVCSVTPAALGCRGNSVGRCGSRALRGYRRSRISSAEHPDRVVFLPVVLIEARGVILIVHGRRAGRAGTLTIASTIVAEFETAPWKFICTRRRRNWRRA